MYAQNIYMWKPDGRCYYINSEGSIRFAGTQIYGIKYLCCSK